MTEIPVFDAHVDTLLRVLDRGKEIGISQPDIYVDGPRLRKGHVGAMGFACWVDPEKYVGQSGFDRVMALLDSLETQCNRYPDLLRKASNRISIQEAYDSGRVACVPCVEGGHFLTRDTAILDQLQSRGIRYLTLVWCRSLDWIDSSQDSSKAKGLTDFGVWVIHELEKRDIRVDLSHASESAAALALEHATKPCLFTHSCCKALVAHPRNVSDNLLRKIRDNGGVIGISLFGEFIRKPNEGKTPVTTSMVADHIDHAVQIAGIDHVGLGSDFDGASDYPEDLKDCSMYPNLIEVLIHRGYKNQDIKKIFWDNLIRLF